MDDYSAFEAVSSLIRRKYSLSGTTKLMSSPTPAASVAPYLGERADPTELAILVAYKNTDETGLRYLLTTRRVIIPTNDGARVFPYSGIDDWFVMPFPRTRTGEFYRLRIVSKNGDVGYLEGDPGGGFDATLATLVNRVRAAKRTSK